MPTYVIAMMAIHDPVTYRKYTDRTPPIIRRHGGRFLTRGEPVTTMEGEVYQDRLVILEFPSKAHVEAWLSDPEYQEVVVYRHASSTMRMLVQDGGDNTETPDAKV